MHFFLQKTLRRLCRQNPYNRPCQNVRRKVYPQIQTGKSNQCRQHIRRRSPSAVNGINRRCRRKGCRGVSGRKGIIPQPAHQNLVPQQVIRSRARHQGLQQKIADNHIECQRKQHQQPAIAPFSSLYAKQQKHHANPNPEHPLVRQRGNKNHNFIHNRACKNLPYPKQKLPVHLKKPFHLKTSFSVIVSHRCSLGQRVQKKNRRRSSFGFSKYASNIHFIFSFIVVLKLSYKYSPCGTLRLPQRKSLHLLRPVQCFRE